MEESKKVNEFVENRVDAIAHTFVDTAEDLMRTFMTLEVFGGFAEALMIITAGMIVEEGGEATTESVIKEVTDLMSHYKIEMKPKGN